MYNKHEERNQYNAARYAALGALATTAASTVGCYLYNNVSYEVEVEAGGDSEDEDRKPILGFKVQTYLKKTKKDKKKSKKK